jgi:hypothetical protein
LLYKYLKKLIKLLNGFIMCLRLILLQFLKFSLYNNLFYL